MSAGISRGLGDRLLASLRRAIEHDTSVFIKIYGLGGLQWTVVGGCVSGRGSKQGGRYSAPPGVGVSGRNLWMWFIKFPSSFLLRVTSALIHRLALACPSDELPLPKLPGDPGSLLSVHAIVATAVMWWSTGWLLTTCSPLTYAKKHRSVL